MTTRIAGWRVPALAALLLATTSAGPAASGESPAKPASDGVVQALMHKALAGVPGTDLDMVTVEYPPGGSSPPHRHHAQVFVYVLAGSVRMQVNDSPAVTLEAGQTFYEGPDDEHTVSANASQSVAAKILVFMVKGQTANH